MNRATDSRAEVVHWELCEQLRLAHLTIDRLRVELAQETHRNGRLEQENEAHRDLIAVLAASVGGAVL